MLRRLSFALTILLLLSFTSTAFAAIAFDNAASVSNFAASGQANTTYTMGSAANGVLFVWNEAGGASDPTSITFNGSALTKIISGRPAAFTISLWCLANPASGAHSVVVSSTAQIYYSVESFTGVSGCTLDNSTSSNATSVSAQNTLTPVAANTWMLSYVEDESTASFTASSTNAIRSTSGQFGDMAMTDSSGTIAAATPHTQAVIVQSSAWGMVSATIAPAVAAATSSNALFFAGD